MSCNCQRLLPIPCRFCLASYSKARKPKWTAKYDLRICLESFLVFSNNTSMRYTNYSFMTPIGRH
jgi:hypothetical protein